MCAAVRPPASRPQVPVHGRSKAPLQSGGGSFNRRPASSWTTLPFVPRQPPSCFSTSMTSTGGRTSGKAAPPTTCSNRPLSARSRPLSSQSAYNAATEMRAEEKGGPSPEALKELRKAFEVPERLRDVYGDPSGKTFLRCICTHFHYASEDCLVRYKPLKIEFVFNESIRSIDSQQKEIAGSVLHREGKDFEKFASRNAKIEYFARSFRNDFGVVELSSTESDPFMMLQGYIEKREGLPVGGLRKTSLQHPDGTPTAFILGTTGRMRCLVIGLLHVKKHNLPVRRVVAPLSLTTLTSNLLKREERSRVRYDPIRMRAEHRAKGMEALIKEEESEGENEDVLDDILMETCRSVEIFDPSDDEGEEKVEEAYRMQKIVQEAFQRRGLSAKKEQMNRVLCPAMEETLKDKRIKEVAPRRPFKPKPSCDSLIEDASFVKYEECSFTPQYIVAYEGNRYTEYLSEYLHSISSLESSKTGENFLEQRREYVSPFEITIQWNCPITHIQETLRQKICTQFVKTIEPFPVEFQKAYDLTWCMRVFKEGVLTVDVLDPTRRFVHYRHTALFSDNQ